MTPVSKAEFARSLCVSRAAVTQAVKRGKLIVLDDGRIDTDDRRVKAYVEKHRLGDDGKAAGQKRAHIAKKNADPSNHGKPSSNNGSGKRKSAALHDKNGDDEDADFEADTEQLLTKTLAEIQWKKTQIQLNLVRIAEKMGVLIHRDIVARKFAALDGEIKARILEIPKRAVPQMMAMTKSGATQQEITEYLNGEIADSIREAKKASKKS